MTALAPHQNCSTNNQSSLSDQSCPANSVTKPPPWPMTDQPDNPRPPAPLDPRHNPDLPNSEPAAPSKEGATKLWECVSEHEAIPDNRSSGIVSDTEQTASDSKACSAKVEQGVVGDLDSLHDAWRTQCTAGIDEPMPSPLPASFPVEFYRRWGLTPSVWEMIYQRFLFKYRHLNSSWFDIEDAISEVFVDLLAKEAGKDQPIINLIAMLHKKVRWKFLDHRRKQCAKRRDNDKVRTPNNMYIPESTDHGTMDPAKLAAQPEVAERIGKEMRYLSDDEQAVLVLMYFKDFTVTEIAKCLKITRGMVYYWLERARERLHRLLGEDSSGWI